MVGASFEALARPTAPAPTTAQTAGSVGTPDRAGAPDAARIAAHLDGPADEALLDAAARPGVRGAAPMSWPRAPTGLPRDAATRRWARRTPVGGRARRRDRVDAGDAPPRMRREGRSSTAPGRAVGASGRARGGRRGRGRVGGVWIAAGLGSGHGRPSIEVAGVDRLHRDGRLEAGRERHPRVRAVVAPDAGERVAVALPGGGRVVLGDDDAVEVACDPAVGDGCERAALALLRGEALVVAGGATTGSAVLLLPGMGRAAGMGRLEVTAGAVHVALGAATVAEVALRADGRVRFTAPGLEAREWAGPGRVALHGGAGDWVAGGAAAASLFRDLEFALVSTRLTGRVSARASRSRGRWRPPSDARARPAVRPRRRPQAPAELDEVVADARSVRLPVRVQPRLRAPLPDTVPASSSRPVPARPPRGGPAGALGSSRAARGPCPAVAVRRRATARGSRSSSACAPNRPP
jgi:hypothetical protein